MSDGAWAWATLVGLGAFHGLNPGMGWLFAVGLGLQERDRGAVVRALGPIAVGHALAILAALAVIQVGLAVVAARTAALAGAAVLVGFGVYKLARRRHPRWVGMRVRPRDLVLWSFVMATAHGAGLMLLPVALRLSARPAAQAHPVIGLSSALSAAGGEQSLVTLAVAGVHSAVMLAVMGGVALWVYEEAGLKVLRTHWINLDMIWAAALIVAGVCTLFT